MKYRELTNDEVEMLVLLKFMDNPESIDGLYQSIIDKGGWTIKVIENRFNAFGFSVDKKVQIMILFFSDGITGVCVKHVDHILKILQVKNIKTLDFITFNTKIYPLGVPIL